MEIKLNRTVGSASRVSVDGQERFGLGVTYSKVITPYHKRYPNMSWVTFFKALEQTQQLTYFIPKEKLSYADRLLFNVEGFKACIVSTRIIDITSTIDCREREDGFIISFKKEVVEDIARKIYLELYEEAELVSVAFYL